MAKINLPSKIVWNGREIPVEGAMERVLNAEPSNSVLEPEQLQSSAGNMPDLNGYVYVKPLGIYVAKERSLQNHNWKDTHRELIKQGLEMPTPKETWDILFYLQNRLSDSDFKKLYGDILKKTPKDTWHGEWQNAIFSKEKNVMYVQKVIGLETNGELKLSQREQLENCFMQDGWASASQADLTKQELCKVASGSNSYEQGKNIYFWYPRNGAVAGFVASSGWASLDCSWVPGDSNASLGVRAIKHAVAKKNGAKK